MSNPKAEAALSAYDKMHARVVSNKKPKRKKVKVKREPKAVGNPRIELRPEQFYAMARKNVSRKGIAGFLGVSDDTIARRLTEPEFLAEYERGKADREVWLRDAQDKAVDAGDASMMKFLGKNELGQTDKIESEVTVWDGDPTKLTDKQLDKLAGTMSVVAWGNDPARIEAERQKVLSEAGSMTLDVEAEKPSDTAQ